MLWSRISNSMFEILHDLNGVNKYCLDAWTGQEQCPEFIIWALARGYLADGHRRTPQMEMNSHFFQERLEGMTDVPETRVDGHQLTSGYAAFPAQACGCCACLQG